MCNQKSFILCLFCLLLFVLVCSIVQLVGYTGIKISLITKHTMVLLVHYNPGHQNFLQQFIKSIQEGYNQFSCRVLHNCQLTTSFETKSGVRHRCLLSPLLFQVHTYVHIYYIPWSNKLVT
jgi:hypothetical protein